MTTINQYETEPIELCTVYCVS